MNLGEEKGKRGRLQHFLKIFLNLNSNSNLHLNCMQLKLIKEKIL